MVRLVGSFVQSGRCLLVGMSLMGLGLVGCSTGKDAIQKSQGHYQEGVANLARDRQKAFVSFQKSVQLHPENKEAHYALGYVYALQGKLKQAEQEFRAAIKIDETYSEAHTYLGHTLVRQNKWDEGIKSYQQALANPLYPTPDLTRFYLGLALAHQGDLQGAVEALEDAAVADPPSVAPAATHLELGRVYSQLGYTARAREVLQKVATFDKGGELAAAAAELLARLK